MKAYIASPIRLRDLNVALDAQLREKLGIKVFLPASLHEYHESPPNMRSIAEKCYKEIDDSQIIILVIPFGLSVAAEIGYVVEKKRQGMKKWIVAYRSGLGNTKDEAMINPYVDYYADSLETLLETVSSLAHVEQLLMGAGIKLRFWGK